MEIPVNNLILITVSLFALLSFYIWFEDIPLRMKAKKLTYTEKCTLNDMLTQPLFYSDSHKKLLKLGFVKVDGTQMHLTQSGYKVGYSLTAASVTCPL